MSHRDEPVLALVPARGGSKGLPRKNLALLQGRPLVEFTLVAAKQSRTVDVTYLSSDDREILEVAERVGAIPLLRPAEYATDHASAVDVVRHFIGVIPAAERARNPFIVYLQPTSPLRTAHHIDQAFQLLAEQNATTLVSVSALECSPFKSFRIDDDGRLKSLFDEKLSNARRHDLPAAFIPNGAIYVFRVEEFLSRGGFPSDGSVPFVMDSSVSVDVDTREDLACVEQAMGEKHG